MGFLQIYRNKRAPQRKFCAYIFSEQLFAENIFLKFPLLGSFVAINLKKRQSRKWSTCQSLKIYFSTSKIILFDIYSSEILLIDSIGCPTDYTIMGVLDEVNGKGQILQANFEAFKFPTSSVVQFRALVTPCIPR